MYKLRLLRKAAQLGFKLKAAHSTLSVIVVPDHSTPAAHAHR